jgi:pimeloyl-ACP methyl ester carboxylesterase
MRRQLNARLVWATGLMFALLATPTAYPQNNVDRVKFDTCDGVELHGSFYPSRNGAKSTCVILLHNIGGDAKNIDNSQQDGWDRLAKALQAEGFAVLSFDFRGHGNSTQIQPSFWKYPQNAGLRGFGKAESISYKDYQKSYYPILVNDIAAAKALLDRRNDSGECNSRSIILVGAQEGAVVGTMWAVTEWSRYQLLNVNLFAPAALDKNPEGKSIIACVWLSMSSSQSELGNWLKLLGKEKRMPMGFLYGANDATAANFAQRWAKELKGKNAPTDKLTSAEGTPKSSLAGHNLLRKDLNTVEKIATYCKKVVDTVTPSDQSKIEFEKKGYAWSFQQGGRPIIAKKLDEKLLSPIPISNIGVRAP